MVTTTDIGRLYTVRLVEARPVQSKFPGLCAPVNGTLYTPINNELFLNYREPKEKNKAVIVTPEMTIDCDLESLGPPYDFLVDKLLLQDSGLNIEHFTAHETDLDLQPFLFLALMQAEFGYELFPRASSELLRFHNYMYDEGLQHLIPLLEASIYTQAIVSYTINNRMIYYKVEKPIE